MQSEYKSLKTILNKKYKRGFLNINEAMFETGLGKGQVRMYLHKFRVGKDCFSIDGVAQFLAKKVAA